MNISQQLNSFSNTIDSIMNEILKQYKVLFTASMSLFIVALLGLSNIYPALVEHDFQSQKLKFDVEAATGKSLAELNCQKLEQHQSNCNLAKHQINITDQNVMIFFKIVNSCIIFGVLFLIISIISYIPTSANKKIEHKNSKEIHQ